MSDLKRYPSNLFLIYLFFYLGKCLNQTIFSIVSKAEMRKGLHKKTNSPAWSCLVVSSRVLPYLVEPSRA